MECVTTILSILFNSWSHFYLGIDILFFPFLLLKKYPIRSTASSLTDDLATKVRPRWNHFPCIEKRNLSQAITVLIGNLFEVGKLSRKFLSLWSIYTTNYTRVSDRISYRFTSNCFVVYLKKKKSSKYRKPPLMMLEINDSYRFYTRRQWKKKNTLQKKIDFRNHNAENDSIEFYPVRQ